eukprot:gene8126-8996_t
MACHFAVTSLVLFVCLASNMKMYDAMPASLAKYETLDSRCEPLTIQMCKKLPYNTTHFPNILGHETQREANQGIVTFAPLLRINCSPDLLQFLCSLYAPVCMSMSSTLHLLPPCRHHCKKVRKGCVKVLKTYGFRWPEAFKCNKFPKKKSNSLCVDWSKNGGRKGTKNKKKNGKGSRKRKGGRKNKKNKRNGRKKASSKRNKRGKKSSKKAGKGKNKGKERKRRKKNRKNKKRAKKGKTA